MGAGAAGGGFTAGRPWLIPVDAARAQRGRAGRDPASQLELARALLELRPRLGPGVQMLEASVGVLAFARGAGHVVAINTTDAPRPLAAVAADPLIETQAGALRDGYLAAGTAVVLSATRGEAGLVTSDTG